MRFFDHCAKFVALVEENDAAMCQVNAFKEGPEMKKVLEKVASALCLPVEELNAGKKFLLQVASAPRLARNNFHDVYLCRVGNLKWL